MKTKTQKIINKLFWIIGTSRNAILVIVCGAIGFVFHNSAGAPFKLIGAIPPGMPSVQPPPFSYENNGTTVTFSEMVSAMGSGIIVVPLISLMENIAICKAFGEYLFIYAGLYLKVYFLIH